MLDRILDRLEEWIVVTLIGAATALTFVAVVHRYGASNSANVARWASVHHLLLLKAAANAVYVWLASINLSWAQELATYMLVCPCCRNSGKSFFCKDFFHAVLSGLRVTRNAALAHYRIQPGLRDPRTPATGRNDWFVAVTLRRHHAGFGRSVSK